MSLHENYESCSDMNSIHSLTSSSINSTNSSNYNDQHNNITNSNNFSIKSHKYQNSINSSNNDINSENVDYFFTYNNNVIPVTLEELHIFENNSINIAILSNYYDKKDDSQFLPLYLPEISITYNSLIKLFFNSCGKNFSPFILNKIWNSVRGLNLANEFLKIFEKKTELSRNDLSIVSKIKLYKEWSFSSITSKASKIFALNLDELNSILVSGQYREDGKIYVSINFLLYSEILEIGINIIMPLLLSNVSKSLYVNCNDSISFDFETSTSCSDSITHNL